MVAGRLFHKIGQNTGLLLLVNLAGAGMGFLMAAALGRGLGEAGFGRYSLVMTWLLSLLLFTEFGLSTVLTRDVAARPATAAAYLVHSLAAKALLGLPAALLLLVLASWLAPGRAADVAAALRWGVIFLYTGLAYSSFTALFKARQEMVPILWLTLSGQVILLGGTLGLLLARQPLPTLIVWTGLSQGGQCLLAIVFYRRLGLFPLSARDLFSGPSEVGRAFLSLALIRLLLHRAWPFALAGLLAALQLRANILLLAYLQGDQAMGWYAAANRFAEAGRQLPGAFYAAILPAMAALAAAPGPDLQKTLAQARLGLLAFGLLAGLGALLLADPVIYFTYGPGYEPAIPVLQLLSLSLVPAGQNNLLLIYLYARRDEQFVNLLALAGLVINLGLCLWLIPPLGAAGVAVALLLAESLLYLPYRWRAHRLSGEIEKR